MKPLLMYVAAVALLLTAGCKHENHYCDNGGYWSNGNCNCPPGSSGPHCDNTTSLMFWVPSYCCDSTITVTCDSQTQYINEFFPNNTPACGTRGCANFNLPAGTYQYTASCPDTTWKGSVTVVANQCNMVELFGKTANLTFWVDSAASNIQVALSGANGFSNTANINTAFPTTTPTCGTVGCANFTLPGGTYTYTATTSSGIGYTGTVNAKNDSCVVVKVY